MDQAICGAQDVTGLAITLLYRAYRLIENKENWTPRGALNAQSTRSLSPYKDAVKWSASAAVIRSGYSDDHWGSLAAQFAYKTLYEVISGLRDEGEDTSLHEMQLEAIESAIARLQA